MTILQNRKGYILIKTKDEEETVDLGREIGALLKKGDVIALTGELGTGKTYLTKGIAEGLGLVNNVKSPTFVLINEYKGKIPLYHFDCYRINSKHELERLGYEEYFYGSGVTVVEWADKVKELLPKECIKINIVVKNENEREFEIQGLFF